MLSVEEARDTILSHFNTLPPEKIYLENALGRFLAEDIYALRDLPPWNNSAMDGYAIHCEDVPIKGIKLPVAYEIAAGKLAKSPLAKGQAVKIMTGAPLPQEADAVVKREDTEELEHHVIIKTVPKKFENIRFSGEDIKKGEVVLTKGTLINPAHIGILASLKRFIIYCYQRPIVGILATGDEIADLDDNFSPDTIVSSNSYTLISLVKAAGGIPLYLGIAKDTRPDLIDKLSMAKRADLIITTGGVSMGDYDLIKDIMNMDDNKMEFWKVDMKPGRPLAFGTINGIPTIGLPGNPVSTMTSFYQFARPAILKMMGSFDLLLPIINARLLTPIENKSLRRHYIRGILKREGSVFMVSTTGPQGSGILTSMANGNCFILVPKGKNSINKDEQVDCEVFQGLYSF